MSNERFKFRVWYYKNNEYVPEGSMCDIHCLLHRDGTLDCGVSYDDGYAGGIDWIKTEDAIIEQCTGLTDKNGKLIFEGDVLQDGENVAAVVWNIDQYLLEYRDGYVGEFSLFAKTFEVVGNIHEGSWINE